MRSGQKVYCVGKSDQGRAIQNHVHAKGKADEPDAGNRKHDKQQDSQREGYETGEERPSPLRELQDGGADRPEQAANDEISPISEPPFMNTSQER